MMLNSSLPSSLLIALGVVSLGFGCGPTDTETVQTKVIDPGAAGTPSGAGSGSGGAGVTAGGGGAGPNNTAGSLPMGGDTSGQAGSTPMGGSDSTTAGTGGMGGTGTGTGGGGGSGGGEDPNKVVLYDGSAETFGGWVRRNGGGANAWKNNPDKTMTVQSGTGDIISKETFQDVFVHVEYKTPMLPSDVGGQERGNSGVYLKSSYEMQVLDTYGKPPALDGCGAIYGIRAPSSVACLQQEMWNTYEIEFKAQVCNEQGQKTANARFLSVKLNGMLVHENVDAPDRTEAGLPEDCAPRGILLQDHSSVLPVSFRNIWVIRRN